MMLSRLTCVVVLAVLLVLPFGNAIAQIHFDFTSPPPDKADIPPDGSMWHELHPNYCTDQTQDAYVDNGDGVMSGCDFIFLDGSRYHITDVLPTYYLSFSTEEIVLEPSPLDTVIGDDPTGDAWHEVYPAYCTEHVIDGWQDADGSMDISLHDYILFGVYAWRIERIGTDIVVEPASAVEHGAWGKVKALFGDLF